MCFIGLVFYIYARIMKFCFWLCNVSISAVCYNYSLLFVFLELHKYFYLFTFFHINFQIKTFSKKESLLIFLLGYCSVNKSANGDVIS